MTGLRLLYRVPRSQVWAGSRGGQSGNVHAHVTEDYEGGRLKRRAGQALCTTKPAWYDRVLYQYEIERLPDGLCPRCVEIAARHELPLATAVAELRYTLDVSEREERP